MYIIIVRSKTSALEAKMKVVILVFSVMVCSISAMKSAEEGCACTKDFNPVCSTANEMFPNFCTLMCDGNIEVDLDRYYNFQTGQCEKLCFCPFLWMPVCTSDSVMFANSCLLECDGDKTVDETKRYDAETRKCVQVSADETPAEETSTEASPVETTPAE